jgi:hypothetical protein
MPVYAKGKRALAICDRSGFRIPYNNLRTEWTGARVAPDEYEPKNPQLTPPKNIIDATALFKPRPDNDPENVSIYVYYNWFDFNKANEDSDGFTQPSLDSTTYEKPNEVAARGAVGYVTIETPVEIEASSVHTQGSVGIETIELNIDEPSVAGAGAVGLTTETVNELAVTVSNPGSGNKYFIDSSQQATLSLVEGNIYRFDQSDSSNSGHPLRLSTTSDGSHSGGSEYTTGVTTSGTPGSAGAYTEITVAIGAPTLYYYCTNHSGMGGTANTPTNVSVTVVLSITESGVAGTGAIGAFGESDGEGMTVSITESGVAGTGAIGSESIDVDNPTWGTGKWGAGKWGQ